MSADAVQTVTAAPMPAGDAAPPRREVIYRHTAIVRLSHWLNVLAMTFLLASGLQIFNAHPELYWGKKGFEINQPFISIHGVNGPGGRPRGETQIAGLTFDTTGFLGASKLHGQPVQRAWPGWLTAPSWQDLALGRRWHFFFAWIFVVNGLVYLLWSFAIRHVQRDIWPTGRDLRGIGRSIVQHVQLKHPTGEEAKRYNVLQRISYAAVALVLLPAMVLTGLTMSPGIDAAAPWLLDLFGGRQSARTVHFLTASLLVLFTLVHVIEVFLAGVFNEMRSMITGRYAVPQEHGK